MKKIKRTHWLSMITCLFFLSACGNGGAAQEASTATAAAAAPSNDAPSNDAKASAPASGGQQDPSAPQAGVPPQQVTVKGEAFPGMQGPVLCATASFSAPNVVVPYSSEATSEVLECWDKADIASGSVCYAVTDPKNLANYKNILSSPYTYTCQELGNEETRLVVMPGLKNLHRCCKWWVPPSSIPQG